MARRVGTHEAKTRLSEYLNQVAYRGERIVIERHGKPVAALVSLEDLRRLESLGLAGATVSPADEAARQASFRRSLEEAGVVVQWPTGPAVPPSARKPLAVSGPPVSEQIIDERR